MRNKEPKGGQKIQRKQGVHFFKDHHLPISILFQEGWASFHLTLAGIQRRELALQIAQEDSSL